jgi:hypothetical protein
MQKSRQFHSREGHSKDVLPQASTLNLVMSMRQLTIQWEFCHRACDWRRKEQKELLETLDKGRIELN